MYDCKPASKSSTFPPFGQRIALCSMAHPSINIASEKMFLTETSIFKAFFNTAFYVGYLPSPVSLNKAVGSSASLYMNKSLIWICSAESKYMTLENIISVLYTSVPFFVLAAFPDVFIVTISFFIVDRKLSGKTAVE